MIEMINEKIVVFTGPSGVGKATIEKKLFGDHRLRLELAVSATTRPRRNYEKEGQHYYFLSPESFDLKQKNNEFIEWSEHFFHKYGTLYSEVVRITSKNKVPFLEVETNGAKSIMKKYGNDKIISFFIKPPSVKELENRIRNRATESEEQIQNRLFRYQKELGDARFFQHVISNETVDKTYETIKKIIEENLRG